MTPDDVKNVAHGGLAVTESLVAGALLLRPSAGVRVMVDHRRLFGVWMALCAAYHLTGALAAEWINAPLAAACAASVAIAWVTATAICTSLGRRS